ncbi:MAG: outer membrane beta-barrel protein, partial [Algoriella sp.]
KNFVKKDTTDSKIRNTKKFRITAGIAMNTPDFSIETRDYNVSSTNDGSSFGATLGLEYFLPINNNKWSLNADLNYINIESHSTGTVYNNVNIKLSEIQVLLNARHYMYINDGSRFFVSLGINTSIINPVLTEDFTQNYANYSDTYERNVAANFVYGIGYKYNNLGFDVRYFTNNRFISGQNLRGNFNLFSLRLTYDIFKF